MADMKLVYINKAKTYYVDSKGYDAKCRVTSSSKIYPVSKMRDDQCPNDEELTRTNGALFSMDTGAHQGIEYSDLYRNGKDNVVRPQWIVTDDEKWHLGFHALDEVIGEYGEEHIVAGLNPAEIVLKDGEIVSLVANWRTDYPKGKYCWSFCGRRPDGSIIQGANDENYTCNTKDIANWLKSMGCTDGFINDGGGSATQYVNGFVINRSSERSVANAIIVYGTKKSGGDGSFEGLAEAYANLENEHNGLIERYNALKEENETIMADYTSLDSECVKLTNRINEKNKLIKDALNV